MTQVGAIGEEVWWLEANGERIGGGTVLPDAVEPFFVGYLASAGLVSARADLLSLDVKRMPDGVIAARALVPLARARAAAEERRHRALHGCGPLYLVRCAPPPREVRTGSPPPIDAFPALFRALYAAADARHDGGVHAAALSDGGALLHQHEDVGRHNAVDKAIGAAILEGEDPARLGLVITSRISGEIAAKAARFGLAWIASRSVPTTLAVRIAGARALTLIARAASRDAAVFLPPS
jgi:formate dehydrogenase accessory protein FdhD